MKSMMFYVPKIALATRAMQPILRMRPYVVVMRHYVNCTSINGPNNEEVPKISSRNTSNTGDGINKNNIKMFAVEAGVFADRLRSHQHQLQCIGGNALKNTELHPQSMIFVNIGVDDKGIVNWSYMAPQLRNNVTLNNVVVAFEAANTAGRVRPGSAVVRYHLEFKNHTANNSDDIFVMLLMITIMSVVFLAFVDGMFNKDIKNTKEYRSPITNHPEPPTIIINTTSTDSVYEAPKSNRNHSRETRSRHNTETHSSVEPYQSSPMIGVAKTGDDE